MKSGRARDASEEFVAAILAGGSGERLGLNKALLDICGRSALDRIGDILKEIFSKILVVVQGEAERGRLAARDLVVVADLLPGKGPLGGIFTALECSDRPYAFVIACDMPYPCPQLVMHLLSRARGHEAVVPRRGIYIEPLFAVYSKSISDRIKARLERGDLKIHDILEELDVAYVDEEEILSLDPHCLSFFNINTPEDLERATKLAGGF
jgi:molybdopterin-guanine dinucleotide biosynthesis protein A